MRLYVPQNPEENREIAAWLGAQLEVTFSPPYLALGVLDDSGGKAGAALFNNFDCANIDLTGAGAGAFTPAIVRALARYVFVQLNCSRVTLRTRRSNRHARKLLARHFKFEVTLKNWFGEEDAFQFRMCRDECPWLERQNAIAIPAAAA